MREPYAHAHNHVRNGVQAFHAGAHTHARTYTITNTRAACTDIGTRAYRDMVANALLEAKSPRHQRMVCVYTERASHARPFPVFCAGDTESGVHQANEGRYAHTATVPR